MIDARSETGAGTIGDILAARVLARGGDRHRHRRRPARHAGRHRLDIPTYYRAANAASLWSAHFPLEVDVPIACGGALVMPGDVIVGDADGVLVLPAALAEQVALDAYEEEQREAWALERVQAGESVRGIYPLSDERRAEFERWRSATTTGAEPMSSPFAADPTRSAARSRR